MSVLVRPVIVRRRTRPMPPSDDYDEAGAARAVAVMTARRAVRPAVLWGLVFGASAAASMSTYVTSFPTEQSRTNLARTIEGNPAFEAIFGIIRRIDTVAGYTAYKTMFTFVIIGAIWGLFIATKVTRGEE